MNLLDSTALDVASAKVSQLITDLETLNKAQVKGGKAKGSKGGGNSGALSEEQLSVLAGKVESLEGFEKELPGLLLRLRTMATVHQEVA